MALVSTNSLILLLVYLYLFMIYRTRYLGLWCLGGILIMSKLGLDFYMVAINADLQKMPLPFKVADQLTVIGAAFLITAGTSNFTSRPLSRLWGYMFGAGIILSLFGSISAKSFLFMNLPSFLLFGISFIWMGRVYYSYPRVDWFGKKITGVVLILWGLHFIEYPFDRELLWLAPFGYYLSAVFSAVSVLGILFIYFFQTRNELAASEERFRLLAENARDIVYRFRDVGGISFEYINPAIEAVTGYTPKEICRAPFILQGIKATEKPDVFRVFRRDGAEVWLEQRNAAVRDDNGRIVGYEGVARDVTEMMEREKYLRQLGYHDPLTGLGNRLCFDEELAHLETGSADSAAIIVCDIDNLKLVNDRYGHHYGDIIIKEAADLLRAAFPDNRVCRIGGDEFAVIISNKSREELLSSCALIAHDQVGPIAGQPGLYLQISCGLAVAEGNREEAARLFREADRMMYLEKRRKREETVRKITSTAGKEGMSNAE